MTCYTAIAAFDLGCCLLDIRNKIRQMMLLTFTTAAAAGFLPMALAMATSQSAPAATVSSHHWIRKGTQRIAYEVAVPTTDTAVDPVVLLNGFGE